MYAFTHVADILSHTNNAFYDNLATTGQVLLWITRQLWIKDNYTYFIAKESALHNCRVSVVQKFGADHAQRYQTTIDPAGSQTE